MIESKPIDHVQSMKYENLKDAMMKISKTLKRTKFEKVINVGWVYNLKLKPNSEVAKYKARLVSKVFLQNPGIFFNEVYA